MSSSIISRPSVSHFLRFKSGRDKLMHVLQYYSRLEIWQLVKQNSSAIPKERWTRFMRQLVHARTLVRVGRGVEHMQTTVEAMSSNNDFFIRHVSALHQLLSAARRTFDIATLLDNLGLCSWKAARLTQGQAARFRLGAVLCGLFTQLYCLLRVSQKGKAWLDADAKTHVSCDRFISNLQILAHLCDLVTSSSAVGLTQLDGRVIGVCGINIRHPRNFRHTHGVITETGIAVLRT
ncbi:peroxisomal biogenesis factor 11 [Dactylonectria estremocensis]|uniref:Peroxisomal biogenesis factor 11 n=1 Tax=Dactylonectria estremocensis TaxID=1079267 RepID=A0A9P9E7X9_9HYPO|nr:peroxisomal biogenesis factor 11 [Dactylonectria estremocensis]